jgi:hypothetical protein
MSYNPLWVPYHFVTAANNNATVVKSRGGQVGVIVAFNVNAAARYLKFYDKATTPAPATDTPVFVVAMPGASTGAGSSVTIQHAGLNFLTGISVAVVTGLVDTDNSSVGSGDCTISLGYF